MTEKGSEMIRKGKKAQSYKGLEIDENYNSSHLELLHFMRDTGYAYDVTMLTYTACQLCQVVLILFFSQYMDQEPLKLDGF